MQLLLPYEVWKDIKGYEGLYQVSARGNVKCMEKKWPAPHGGTNIRKECIKNQPLNKYGYPFVSLSKKSKKWPITVHRLIAIAFIPNPENKPEINHNNGIKRDNNVHNLEWATSKENSQHAWRTGLQKSSEYQKKVVSKMFKGKKKDPLIVEKSASKLRGRKRTNYTNANSKSVINRSNGLFFDSMKSAWNSQSLFSYTHFRDMINGKYPNNTSFILYSTGELDFYE